MNRPLRAIRRVEALNRIYERLRNEIVLRRLAHELKGPSKLELVDREAGFFSLYFQALAALQICRWNRQRLVLCYDRGAYFDPDRDDDSWWSHYFMSASYDFSSGSQPETRKRLEDTGLLTRLAYAGTCMGRVRANRLSQLFEVNAEIKEFASAFANNHFADRCVVGLHYRGTDKVAGPSPELERVPYEFAEEILHRLLPQDAVVFVATDEIGFLERIRESYGERALYAEANRSNDETPLHQGKGRRGSVALGNEALADAILLSRCHFLLRCDSNLSLASLFFNRRLKSIDMTDLVKQTKRKREIILSKAETFLEKQRPSIEMTEVVPRVK